MALDFTISFDLPRPPEDIYKAWLDSRKHTEMTGGEAEISGKVGGRFTAWDGYISGRNLDLEPHRLIRQSWRTSQFRPGDSDSVLELEFADINGGTRITLRHSDIPGDQPDYERGWEEHYIRPMERYFGGG